jgi:serine/threonine protein kinase
MFSEDHIASLIHQIMLAVNYLHSTKNFVHRNLRLDNILCSNESDENFIIKISDFTNATSLESEDNKFSLP